jgi:hypothetical protein
MENVVISFKSARSTGHTLVGKYDGYGRVLALGDVEHEIIGLGEFTLRHQACSRAAGNPGFQGQSASAPDQGWFFRDGEYDMVEPGTYTNESERLEALFILRRARKHMRETTKTRSR